MPFEKMQSRSQLARAVAERLIEIAKGKSFKSSSPYVMQMNLILAGGSIIDLFFKEIYPKVESSVANGLSWDVSWIDERLVPRESPDSNCGTAERLAASLGIHNCVFHFLTKDAVEFEANCRARWDVALLGMGEDGHFGSIFPGPIADCLVQMKGQVYAIVENAPKPPPLRITMTPWAVDALCEHVIFAIVGPAKEEAFDRIADGKDALFGHLEELRKRSLWFFSKQN